MTRTEMTFNVMVQGAAITKRHTDHVALCGFSGFADRFGHLTGFTRTKTNTAFRIADHDQSSEAKPATTLNHFSDTVNANEFINQFWFFTLIVAILFVLTRPSSLIT